MLNTRRYLYDCGHVEIALQLNTMDATQGARTSSFPVIIFDGMCVLCSGAAEFIIRYDKRAMFRLTTLQSEWTKDFAVTHPEVVHRDTIILVINTGIYTESQAVLRIARLLGFPFSSLTLLYIIPSFIRNAAYRAVARRRYAWFGKRDTCFVAGPEVRERILP